MVLVVVLAVFLSRGGADSVSMVQQAREAINRGDYAAAVALLEQVPAGDSLHGQAQELLIETRQFAAVSAAREESAAPDSLWGTITALRQDHVDSLPVDHALRSPNCRYLLRRVAEFLEKYPNHPMAAEAAKLPHYYAKVASLDRPPTEADARVEARFWAQARQFGRGVAVIEEFRRADPANAAAADVELNELRKMASAAWDLTRDRLERNGALTAGSENWASIESQCRRYLESVEGLSGVSSEAESLLARAIKAQAGG
ncbi:MAG: hypothetical protein ACT4PU_04575 [Planctomycetota bacterium]